MLRKAISHITAATFEEVAAVESRKIRVLGYYLVSAGTMTVRWQSGSNNLTGTMTLTAGTANKYEGSNSLDLMPCFESNHGEALNLTTTGGVQVSGFLIYDIVA